MISTKPFNPFLFYSSQLQALLALASKQKNPALWLYQNNARTPLFMLEALTRLHNKSFDEKMFSKWNIRFKKLEDILGAIDYFDHFEKQFKLNKHVSPAILASLNEQQHLKLNELNSRLSEKGWLQGRLFKFNVKISQYSIILDEDYASELKKSIEGEIKVIKTFALRLNYSFTQLEEEVHELRRKLRWISIYSLALNGVIQLSPSVKKNYSTNYFTKDIIQSPFNKLAAKPFKTAAIIKFDKQSFLALSWLIKSLGDLKDKGLTVELLSKEIEKTEKCTAQIALEKTVTILNISPETEKEILKKASNITYQFLVKDKLLDSLVL